MRLSPKGRVIADIVLVAGIVALSFMPVVGTEQTHFPVVAGTLRVFAAVYLAIAFAMKSRMRALIDGAMVAMLALMAYAETFPAGNHITEQGIYGGLALIVLGLAIASRTTREAVPAPALQS